MDTSSGLRFHVFVGVDAGSQVSRTNWLLGLCEAFASAFSRSFRTASKEVRKPSTASGEFQSSSFSADTRHVVDAATFASSSSYDQATLEDDCYFEYLGG